MGAVVAAGAEVGLGMSVGLGAAVGGAAVGAGVDAGANWTLGAGVVAGFLLWLLVLSLVAMASSAYVKWKVVAAAVSLAFFFILTGISQMINGVFRVTWGYVLDPAWATNRVWCALLGVRPPEGPGTAASACALAAIVLLLVVVIERKLRPVEVVS